MRLVAAFAPLLALTATAQSPDVDTSLDGADDGTKYWQQMHPCPKACTGGPSTDWIAYHEWDRFALCEEPLLMSFGLSNPLTDPATPVKILTCTVGNADSKVNALFHGKNSTSEMLRRQSSDISSFISQVQKRETSSSECEEASARKSAVESEVSLQWVLSGTDTEVDRNGPVVTALETLQAHFESGAAGCEETFMFSYHQGVVAGVYVGASFDRKSVAGISQLLTKQVQSTKAATVAAQLCGRPNRSARHTLGMVVDTSGNITAVQEAVLSWSEARCIEHASSDGSASDVKGVTVFEDKAGLGPFGNLTIPSNGTYTNGTFSNSTLKRSSLLHRRADCTTISVENGDSCASLASQCGVSSTDFVKFNSDDPSLCSSLTAGSLKGNTVCCSAGTKPQPKVQMKTFAAAAATCATHVVLPNSGDTCWSLSQKYKVNQTDIEKWNKGTTWGWYSCEKIYPPIAVCVGQGSAPIPVAQPGAVCGPTMENGKDVLSGDKQLKDLNPCPLNACCNVWGQCGISGEFCTEKKSESGNPGTSGLRNGCVSNCGTDIKSDGAVGSFGRIGYYETWNFNRPCLWQHAENANTDGTYTIIHWAFAEINLNDWTPKINDTYKQWQKFKDLKGVKRVVSFGGWGYSTEPATYNYLRQAMNPTNRATFVNNVAKFLADNSLDGVDFDWEYPGAPDIPTAPSQPDDAPNYLKFLTSMKSKLAGTGRSLSIAAPASFWYLKQFPIKQMALQLDYIVFMTYDLHGQWDAGNQYSIDGCPSGNCIRSHVNLTETGYTLAMITKAGVSSNKIFVGESSYARSFKLAKANCEGPMCEFLGDRLNSQAAKGPCTDTAGYISNAEIEQMRLFKPDDNKVWHDADSNSDMFLYNSGQEWGAYMTKTTKDTRRTLWQGKGFQGTIDWATDLQAFTADEGRNFDEGRDDEQELPSGLADCKDGPFDSIEHVTAYPPGVIPEHCINVYIAEVLGIRLKAAMDKYDKLIKEGYDKKFNTYADAVANSGDKVVSDFMYGHGKDYFSCRVRERVPCCKACEITDVSNKAENCKYCNNDVCNGWSIGCSTLPRPPSNCAVTEKYIDVSPNCPPDYSKRAGKEPATGYHQSIYWTLKEDRKAAFWADLFTNTAIEEKDIKWIDRKNYECIPPSSKTCGETDYDYNFPVTSGYDRSDVSNPKDVVQTAYKNLKDLVADFPKAVDQLKTNKYDGSSRDFVDAVSVPIFMVEEAVGAVEEIDDIVDKWEDEKRKNTILLFISAILFFVPIIGELVGTVAALASVGRIIALIGAAAEIANGIYNVVNTKGNDPLEIFGLVLAPLAIFDAVKIGKAAARARSMDDLTIGKLGKGVKGKVDTIYKGGNAPMCSIGGKGKRGVDVFPVGSLPMSSSLQFEAVPGIAL